MQFDGRIALDVEGKRRRTDHNHQIVSAKSVGELRR